MQDSSFFHKINSLLVDDSSNVYVYSQMKASASASCSGQHLFKFDTSGIKWSLYNPNDCAPYALTFGRTQNLIYGAGLQSGMTTVFMMNKDSKTLWSQQLKSTTIMPMIGYTSVDASTDMIVFTAGSTKNDMLYWTIKNENDAPDYEIIDKQIQKYTSDEDFTSKIMIAFKVQSPTLFLSLVLDQSSMIISLSKIDLQDTKNSYYNKIFPKIETNSFAFGTFLDNNNYLVGSDASTFFTNQPGAAASFSISQRTTFVMTSNVNLYASCYILSAQSETQLKITTSQKSSELQTSNTLFKQSTTTQFTLNPDTLSTVGIINQDFLVDFPLQCPQKSFTQMSAFQQTSYFVFVPGTATSFTITPFVANQNCGTTLAVYTYKGFVEPSGPELVVSTDYISVNPSTGQIDITGSRGSGTIDIKIVGTLPDSTSVSAIIKLEGNTGASANQLPYFVSAPSDIVYYLNSGLKTFSLPNTFDGDGNTVTKADAKFNGGLLPSFFITFDISSIQIDTNDSIYKGIHTIDIYITDSVSSYNPGYQFKLTIRSEQNFPPILLEDPPTNVYFDFNKNQTLILPQAKDPEGLSLTTKIVDGPKNFIKLLNNNQLEIFPRTCNTDVKTHLVQIQISDPAFNSIYYTFNLRIKNQAPIQIQKIPDQLIMLGNSKQLEFTNFFLDPEGCSPLTVNVDQSYSFFQQNQDYLMIKPSYPFHLGTFLMKLLVSDLQELQIESNVFKITVYQPPKFQNPLMKKQSLSVNKVGIYTLPVDPFSLNQYVKGLNMPSYMTFNYPSFTFNPKTLKSIGVSQVSGSLCNLYACTAFSFQLNVTNTPPFFLGLSSSQLPSLELSLSDSPFSYQLPKPQDLETPSIINMRFSPPLPSFMTFYQENNTLGIAPKDYKDKGAYKISITLIDQFGLSLPNPYFFSLRVVQSRKEKQQKELEKNMKVHNVSFKIDQVMRDGTLQLKFLANTTTTNKQQIGEIVKKIDNSTFKGLLVSRKGEPNSTLQYEILQKNQKNGRIVIQIRYSNPQNISKGQDHDQIIIEVAEQIRITQQLTIIQLQEGVNSIKSLPPQLSSALEKSIVEFFKNGRLNFTKYKIVNFFLALLVQAIWSQLEDLSFLIMLSIVSLSIPGIAQVIQQSLLNLLYFDLLYTEEWMPSMFGYLGYDFDEADITLNENFSENGFESTQFIKNSGSSLIFVFLYLLAWFTLFALKIASLKFQSMQKPYTRLQSHLMWNGSIIFLNSQFSILFMCSSINLTNLLFSDKMLVSSAILSIITLALSITVIVVVFIVTAKRETLPENCKMLKEDLKNVSIFPALKMIRVAITTVIFVQLRNMQGIQVILMQLISFGSLAYLIKKRPHDELSTHCITVFNEAVGVFLYTIGLISLLLDSEGIHQDSLGYFLAYIVSFVVIFNVGFTAVKQIVRRIRRSKKQKKTVRFKVEQPDNSLTVSVDDPNQTAITNNDDNEIIKNYYNRQDRINNLEKKVEGTVKANYYNRGEHAKRIIKISH